MKEIFLKISKYVFGTLFGAIFIFVLIELLGLTQGGLWNTIKNFGNTGNGRIVSEMKILRVVYPDEPVKLEPTLADPTTRQRLSNIYEPLVRTDKNLKIKPSLAVNWGLLDDLTWEFRLRPNVKFQNGSNFNAEDVIASLERAKSYEGSQLPGMMETINSIEIENDLTLKITTKEPDPLLLQRLSMILIIPSELQNEEIKIPIGTGSYEFESWDSGKKIVLKRFDGYWGKKAQFETVELHSKIDKFERVQMLFDDLVDLIVFVPYDGVATVKEEGFNVVTIPSLEVQFIVFNMQSVLMKDLNNREMVSFVINQDDLITSVGGYARRVSQFVSGGIMGFNPKILDHKYDMEKAKLLVEETKIKGKTVQFHLMQGLTVLGDYVKQKLGEVGVNVVVSYLDGVELLKSMEAHKADLYFLGFKSEMGDASEFLHSIVHSVGTYSYWGYENEYVDKLIDVSMTEMDDLSRRKDLQEAMKVLIEDDVFGVPLFEYETVYAFNNKLEVNPPIDGIIHFDELTIK
ncbi:MAG: ABC transporter substrate-binding protein [Candidatus Gracilibacteria bacterium]